MYHLFEVVGIMDKLKDLLLWVPRTIWKELLSALAGILSAIPVPTWLQQIAGFQDAIPSGVGYFLHILKVPQGLVIIMAAYGIRFLIRRIPVIG